MGCYFERDNFSQNSSLGGYPWGATLYDTIQDDGLCISGTTAVNCRPNATSVTIPNSVTSIGSYAFSYCSSLTYVTCYATTAPALSSNVFENLPRNGTLYVPNGSDYSSWLSSLPRGWTIEYI